MLEVKNLRKVYKTKMGAAVNALDGVTLQFPERGMVFLLGKSGSGKSTLLNVCGGLDAPTEGEVIVKGRSSKDFSHGDFDSYRNTFIGFIFQEYNILNEFSVEDNIALALELQGKPKDKKAINALLEEVDLTGYAKRKPNTLSGGQKQRIAIARALVKAPEIIMADEPTGALDSNTGKQVFETLKKLSKTKLVIVVSHDRDFAEQYGDRIIELQDGRVLSDVSKTQLEQQALSDNINAVGDVLCIKRGADLTDADFDKIKSFLKQSGDDVIIANGEKDVKNFKKVSRIGDDGGKEVFRDTDAAAVEKRQYTKEESRFIRSKLPLRHAIKIGVSGLKSKPFRLFMTILLCVVAFVLFSLLSTLNFYDSKATFMQTMADTNPLVMQMERFYKTKTVWYEYGEENGSYEGYNVARFAPDELDEISSRLGTTAFGALEYSTSFNLQQPDGKYWVNMIGSFAVLPEGHEFRQKINGEYPDGEGEIVISSYMADVLFNCKAYDSEGNAMVLNTSADVIGKSITLNGSIYKITGIFDSGAIPSEFDQLKEATEPNQALQMKLGDYLGDGLHLIAFVSEEHIKDLADENPYYYESIYDYTSIVFAQKQDGKYAFPEWSNGMYMDIGAVDKDALYVSISADRSALGDGQTVVSSGLFASIVTDQYYRMAEELSYEDESLNSLRDRYYKTAELAGQIRNGGIYKVTEDKKEEFDKFTDAELQSKLQELIGAIKRDRLDLKVGVKLFDNRNGVAVGEEREFDIAGIVVEGGKYQRDYLAFTQSVFDTMWGEQKALVDYFSQTTSNYEIPSNAVYSKLYLPFSYTQESANEYWKIYSNDKWGEDDSRLHLTGNFISNLQMVDEMVKSLSQIFLYVGLVFAVFAILLFSNFISASISQKKKEIGILRAVGARSADVFRIFFSESFVIAAICVALSTAASIVICNVINAELAEGIGASLFVFGIPSFAVLVAIALLTVLIATFLPVYNAARKKPVDSIRAL